MRGEPEIEVERHRPERWVDAAVAGSICCSSCCCCCCCLHSVGAVAGAATGTVGHLAKTSDDPEARRGVLLAAALYWMGFGVVSLVALIWCFVIEETIIGLLVLAVFTPMLQLVGTFTALPAMLFAPTPAARRAAAKTIGWTSAGWLVGGIAGGIAFSVILSVVLAVAGAAS